MAFSAKWDNGVEVSYKDTKVILDPVRASDSPVFISHAHGDHCRGLKSTKEAYSTRATFELAQLARERGKINHFIEYHRKIALGDVEVEAHDAGHVLGSAQYEIISPEGNVVYTGDINLRDTLLTKRAEVVPCDLLIIESTYGRPCYFPSREYMYERIVEWAAFSIKTGRIPAFQTDALGNAQELIVLLNRFTKIPVVTHPKVSTYNRVYEKFGYKLSYVDAESEDAKETLEGRECVLVVSKNVDLGEWRGLDVAYVSGWGSRFSGRRKAFSLSDHSDFYRLVEYVEKVKPKKVLTCHGSLESKMLLSKKIQRTLHIPSSPLAKKQCTTSARINNGGSRRLRECVTEILRNVKPGFTYPRKWLISATRKGLRRFSQDEVEAGLSDSVKTGKLRYLYDEDSYELRLC